MDDEPLNIKISDSSSDVNNTILEIDQTISSTSSSSIINWNHEARKGSFMPATVKLYKKEIEVSSPVDISTGDTLLHLATTFSFLNVTRCFIEIFKCPINIKNNFGHTPFHTLCNNPKKDIFLLDYFLNNKDLEHDSVDKTGVTPLFYAVANNFHLAFLLLVNKGADLNHTDYNGNNLLYFALVSNNRFAVRFALEHLDLSLNNFFFKDEISLSDLLITNKFSGQTKFLCKHYINSINLKSLNSSLDAPNKFSSMNMLNYELLNLITLYKANRRVSILNKILLNFRYKHYILNFYVWLEVKNLSERIKYLLFLIMFIVKFYYFMYFNDFSLLNSRYNSIENLALLAVDVILKIYFFSTFLSFIYGFAKIYFINNDEPGYYMKKDKLSNRYTVINLLKDSMSISILNTFFEESICEVCLIKKEKKDNHCDVCKRCVRDFYFHSNFFNRCFNKKNIVYYITTFFSLSSINFILIHMYYVSYLKQDGIVKSDYTLSNLVYMLVDLSFFKFVLLVYIIMEAVYFFQTAMVNFLCFGYDVPYYNIFRYHKKSLGVIEVRNKILCNIPEPSVVPIETFWSNIYEGFKNSN